MQECIGSPGLKAEPLSHRHSPNLESVEDDPMLEKQQADTLADSSNRSNRRTHRRIGKRLRQWQAWAMTCSFTDRLSSQKQSFHGTLVHWWSFKHIVTWEFLLSSNCKNRIQWDYIMARMQQCSHSLSGSPPHNFSHCKSSIHSIEPIKPPHAMPQSILPSPKPLSITCNRTQKQAPPSNQGLHVHRCVVGHSFMSLHACVSLMGESWLLI